MSMGLLIFFGHDYTPVRLRQPALPLSQGTSKDKAVPARAKMGQNRILLPIKIFSVCALVPSIVTALTTRVAESDRLFNMPVSRLPHLKRQNVSLTAFSDIVC